MARVLKRVSFKPGDWFVVPLPSGGYATGRIARRKNPVLFGYFFGPRRMRLPNVTDMIGLKATDAIWQTKFGYLGLRDGHWPILGGHEEWIQSEWPMPGFGNRTPPDELNLFWRIHYDNDNPLVMISRARISEAEFSTLPKDGFAGQQYVEGILDNMLPREPA